MSTAEGVTIGVLGIQGAVEEHQVCLKKIGCHTKEVRWPHDLDGLDGIILPGGESTAMAIVGEECGLFAALKAWVQSGKPVWGTCAGMILLSDHAIKKAKCGQTLVGGLDCHVCRNYFGSQIQSCELELNMNSSLLDDLGALPIAAPAHVSDTLDTATHVAEQLSSFASDFYGLYEKSSSGSLSDAKGDGTETILEPMVVEDATNNPFKAVFIRAPAILQVGPSVQVLACINAKPHGSALKEVVNLLEDEMNSCGLNENGKRAAIETGGWIAKRQRSNSDGMRNNISNESMTSMESNSSDKAMKQPPMETQLFNVAVAVRRDNILATAFHPELTDDLRWHRIFLKMVVDAKASHIREQD